jgi:hypothetical protein
MWPGTPLPTGRAGAKTVQVSVDALLRERV